MRLPNVHPSKMLPMSPMNTRAFGMFKGRKPKQERAMLADKKDK